METKNPALSEQDCLIKHFEQELVPEQISKSSMIDKHLFCGILAVDIQGIEIKAWFPI